MDDPTDASGVPGATIERTEPSDVGIVVVRPTGSTTPSDAVTRPEVAERGPPPAVGGRATPAGGQGVGRPEAPVANVPRGSASPPGPMVTPGSAHLARSSVLRLSTRGSPGWHQQGLRYRRWDHPRAR